MERQRFQRARNLERMLLITAFLAARLPQLREHLHSAAAADSRAPWETTPTSEEWHVLPPIREQRAPPGQVLSLHGAWLAIARLGGSANAKRTGRHASMRGGARDPAGCRSIGVRGMCSHRQGARKQQHRHAMNKILPHGVAFA